MTALTRYLWSDFIRSHRWVAPLLAFLIVESIISATTGAVLPTYGGVSLAVLFLSIWVAVIVLNNEDPIQTYVTTTAAQGDAKLRLAKLSVAFQGAVILGLLGLVAPTVVASGTVGAVDIGAGAVGVVATATAGVAVGAMCARPIITRTSWALLLGMCAGLGTVLIPHCPPTRQLLVFFSGTADKLVGSLGLVLAETLLLSAILVIASVMLSRRRV